MTEGGVCGTRPGPPLTSGTALRRQQMAASDADRRGRPMLTTGGCPRGGLLAVAGVPGLMGNSPQETGAYQTTRVASVEHRAQRGSSKPTALPREPPGEQPPAPPLRQSARRKPRPRGLEEEKHRSANQRCQRANGVPAASGCPKRASRRASGLQGRAAADHERARRVTRSPASYGGLPLDARLR